jgi:hypothetical protein
MKLITRRKLILGFVLAGGAGVLFMLRRIKILRAIYNRINYLIHPPEKIPPDDQRELVLLPSEGGSVSVEMALNSRCSSDYDNNPKIFHWGMFDRNKRLSDKQIQKIIHLINIPRFTDRQLNIYYEKNNLSFTVEKTNDNLTEAHWMMVESGMQQQALGLICSAMGVGMVLNGISKDGVASSNNEMITVKAHLDALKPSYEGSFWTDSNPLQKHHLNKGNLPQPIRNGENQLLPILENLNIKMKGSKKADEQAISQLLWAARGRTPHFYKSMPWGMTIPTWGGEQNISSVFLIWEKNLYKYMNWGKNRPNHELSKLANFNEQVLTELDRLSPRFNTYIILSANEEYNRALWEVGYQLFNILIQAKALNLSYHAFLLDEQSKKPFAKFDISDPVAVIAIA